MKHLKTYEAFDNAENVIGFHIYVPNCDWRTGTELIKKLQSNQFSQKQNNWYFNDKMDSIYEKPPFTLNVDLYFMGTECIELKIFASMTMTSANYEEENRYVITPEEFDETISEILNATKLGLL